MYGPGKILEAHMGANIYIDRITKKITQATTAVDTAVITAVVKEDVVKFYKRYTGNKWDKEDDGYFKSIDNNKSDVIEAALIIGVLKGGVSIVRMADIHNTLKDLGTSLSPGYLKQLREIWKSVSTVSKKG